MRREETNKRAARLVTRGLVFPPYFLQILLIETSFKIAGGGKDLRRMVFDKLFFFV